MENEINLDDVVEVAKASLKDKNNVYGEAAEYVKKEKEILNEIIIRSDGKEIKSYNSQKSLIEILNILNSYEYGIHPHKENERNDNDSKIDIKKE